MQKFVIYLYIYMYLYITLENFYLNITRFIGRQDIRIDACM